MTCLAAHACGGIVRGPVSRPDGIIPILRSDHARSLTIVRRGSRMPFKSQAQRRKFAQLLVEGKISNETFEEWNRETGRKKLPERVARKAAKRKKAKTRR
jgi:hypothetical protein